MKKTIKLLAVSITIIIAASCNKEDIRSNGNKLQLKFENIGSEKIKNFKFQGRSIGDIRKNSSTKYYSFDQIRLLDNQILEEASIKTKYGKVDSWFMNENQENWSTLSSGKHTIEISVYYGCGVGFFMALQE